MLLVTSTTILLLLTWTSAFLDTKPNTALSFCCLPSSPSIVERTTLLGFVNSFQKKRSSLLHHVLQCDDAQKQCCGTIFFRTASSARRRISNSDSNNDNNEETETENEMSKNFENEHVYYTVFRDGRQSQIAKIKVNKGDDIIAIKEKIKVQCSPDFDSIPAYRIELFESSLFGQQEPLNALEKWNMKVTWGTEKQPMIVKVNPLTARSVVAVSPWENSHGECVFL